MLKSTSASDGAGIQAAQMILNREIDIVITRFVGLNVFSMLSSKGIDTLLFTTGSVADAIQAYKDNDLERLESPNSPGKDFSGVQKREYKRPRKQI
ncbi:NifB/NifX family molybdenum-iron cluster-binding protein [Methanolobus sp. ZRKC4]|uniref:NifB/NifX family molybdenum-iron cluster-binding protein n=1 Tax=Methanolobus sp. ZRKC4 TaxID=3125787 RepID=UPI0032447B13